MSGRIATLTPNATLESRFELTRDIHRIVVRPDLPVAGFRAGQYFSLGVVVDAERLVQRPYSTATAPGPAERLEFLVRRVPDGALTPALWRLPAGARLRLGPPKGLFTLLADDPRTHVFVATGTGLAPFVSMIAALADRLDPPPAVVVHGVAHVGELAYRQRLEQWPGARLRLRYEPTISRPAAPESAGWDGRTGRAEAALGAIIPGLGDPRDIVAYLCGNPGMILAAEATLKALGLPEGAILTERYWAIDAAAA